MALLDAVRRRRMIPNEEPTTPPNLMPGSTPAPNTPTAGVVMNTTPFTPINLQAGATPTAPPVLGGIQPVSAPPSGQPGAVQPRVGINSRRPTYS